MDARPEKTKRIVWLDAARGIAIILVVLGHCSVPSEMRAVIYAFHMPLFFILSGYLFKTEQSIRDLFFSQVKGIVVPYVFFYLCFMLWYAAYALYSHEPVAWNDHLAGLLIQERGKNYPVFWFLSALLVARIFVFIVTNLFKNRFAVDILFVLTGILSFTYARLIGAFLPWSLDIALIGAAFMQIGQKIRNLQKSKGKQATKMVLMTAAGAATVVLAIFNLKTFGSFDMSALRFKNELVFTVCSICGSMFVIELSKSKVIEKLQFFQYLGKNSLSIYCGHFLTLTIAKKIVSAIPVKFVCAGGILEAFIGLLCVLPLVELYRRFVVDWMLSKCYR